jgi:hypothetical protein
MNYQSFSLVFGFSVWLVATLPFSMWGDAFFRVENPLVLAGFFLGVIPVLYFLAKWVFDRYGLVGRERLESTVLMTIPGMICDVLCLKFHHFVFPKFTIEQAIVLGAWILWVYAIVLLLGVIRSSNKNGIKQRA